MTDQPTQKRPPGRPAAPAAESRRVRAVRLNDARWEKLRRLGSEWLERAIDRARL